MFHDVPSDYLKHGVLFNTFDTLLDTLNDTQYTLCGTLLNTH